MAAYISVPRDLARVKSKTLFNLTKRQLVCFAIAALVGIPTFFLLKKTGNVSLATMGMMLIMLVSVQLNLTPVSGRISDTVFLDDTLPLTGFMLIDTAIWGEQGDFIDALMHMILPAIVLGTIPLAVIVRMTRSSMLEVLGEDYIRTARAKGLTRMRVIVIHALRNAMLPVVTVIGLQVGTLLAGAILTETIFSWPGLGRWLIDALQRRDYPVVQGGVLLVATMIILVNLLVDLLYGVVNPRIRHKK